MIFIIFLPVGFSKLELILNEFFILFFISPICKSKKGI